MDSEKETAPVPAPVADVTPDGEPAPPKDARFWLIFVAISCVTFLVALDTSIISTALPTITAKLNSGELYVWIINSYLLAATTSAPLFGQAADIFGRRAATVASLLLFAAGSAISGAATSTGMLIAGRTIQGFGGGGIATLSEVVVCDLVSLRERGQYAGIISSVWAIAAVVGPIIGGAFTQNVTWRWIFYLNLPISGVTLALVLVLLKMRNPRQGTIMERLACVDWAGYAILTASVTAMLLALTWGGTIHAWSSWRTIVPLVLGFVGLLGFFAYEAAPWVKEPVMPLRLFGNRTAAATLAISFVHSVLLFWICYFLPVYFQAVLNATPARSAVMLFPIATTTAPAGIISGVMITKTGRYRRWHYIGFSLMAIGCGLFTLLDEHSSTGRWVGFQIIFGFGCGFVFTSCLPAILASLPESEVALATATWTFLRNLGSIWGVAIPSAIFNAHADKIARTVSDASLRELLLHGGAYEHATRSFVASFKGDAALYQTILHLYVSSLKIVWQGSIGFAAFGVVLAVALKAYKLRDELNTEYRLENGTKEASSPEPATENSLSELDKNSGEGEAKP
ncbi:hypothetical protein Trisim1_005936 [Trichoderma cf. simile WF8]|uniref:MFS permease n=1 Tax=Trichoderma guizhouense TaxID=1491466 RepID=A0A1T3C558_9HYPO|nr:MFS permease [Trichoderma guizhouense]